MSVEHAHASPSGGQAPGFLGRKRAAFAAQPALSPASSRQTADRASSPQSPRQFSRPPPAICALSCCDLPGTTFDGCFWRCLRPSCLASAPCLPRSLVAVGLPGRAEHLHLPPSSHRLRAAPILPPPTSPPLPSSCSSSALCSGYRLCAVVHPTGDDSAVALGRRSLVRVVQTPPLRTRLPQDRTNSLSRSSALLPPHPTLESIHPSSIP